MEANNGSDVPSDTLASSHETENTATTTTAAAAAVANITSDDNNQLSQVCFMMLWIVGNNIQMLYA